jgi:AcrR family transcriptional regulator
VRGPRRGRGRPRDPSLHARRRTEILRAASACFARRGYPRTDVQHVADALGVGKGTVYRYFPTKRTLFLGCVDRHMGGLLAEMTAMADADRDPLALIAAAFRAYLAYFNRHREFTELLIQERAEFRDRNRPNYRRFLEAGLKPWHVFYARLMAKGIVRRMPVSRITDTTSSLLYGAVLTRLYTGRPKSLTAMTSDLVDIVFHGILGSAVRTGRKGGRR